jgi:hypothetical protein
VATAQNGTSGVFAGGKQALPWGDFGYAANRRSGAV